MSKQTYQNQAVTHQNMIRYKRSVDKYSTVVYVH